jgi:hypothetical protein
MYRKYLELCSEIMLCKYLDSCGKFRQMLSGKQLSHLGFDKCCYGKPMPDIGIEDISEKCILFVAQNPGTPNPKYRYDVLKYCSNSVEESLQFHAEGLRTEYFRPLTFMKKCVSERYFKYVVWDNIVKCATDNNSVPPIEVITQCSGWLLKQINILRPVVIILVGNIAIKYFGKLFIKKELKTFEKLDTLLGRILTIPHYSHIMNEGLLDEASVWINRNIEEVFRCLY